MIERAVALVRPADDETDRPIRPGGRLARNSKAALGAVMAGMLIVGGLGVAVGTRLKSPSQVAAETAPPEASAVTAAVTLQQLSSNLVTRGSIRFSDPVAVNLAGPVGSNGGAGTQVVTSAVEQGTTLAEGDLLLAVSGRPVLVLRGDVPMYRSIGLGDSGDDVRQLEEAMIRLGLDPGPVDGVADAAFMAAIDAFYRARGHEPQGLSDTQQGELRSLTDAVAAAEREVATARAAVSVASKPPTALDVARADAAVQTARDGVDAAQRSATRDTEAARADAAAKQRALDQARSGVTTANAALEQANRQRTDALQADPVDAAAVAAAEQAVTEATTAVASANAAIATAQAELDAANRAVNDAVASGDAARRQAASALGLAEAERRALDGPRDTAGAAAQLDVAQQSLRTAQDNLSRFQSGTGTTVPAGEIVFVPSFPLRVDEVKVKVGDAVTGAVMTLSGAELAVDTAVSVADRDLIREGAPVTVTASDFDITTNGTISLIDTKPGTRGVDAQSVYVAVVLDDPNLAAELAGASVRVSIPVDSTAGEVLTVPVTAVTTRADSTTSVLVQAADGTTREVTVETGLASGGEVEVTPIDGSLDEADRVVVSERPTSSAAETNDEAGES